MPAIDHPADILVLGATGKTGRLIVNALQSRNVPVRPGSRDAERPFSWQDHEGWDHALQGVRSVYIAYAPDLAVPGAPADIAAFTERARKAGVEQLVLLSGRGEPEAEASETIIRQSGLRWTVIRSSWFFQNFDQGAFQPMVAAGELALPVGQTAEPFIDIRDIADIAVAALTGTEHVGQLYEVTGRQLLSFADIAALITERTGRPVRHVDIPHQAFIDGARAAGLPQDHVWLLDYLFSTVLDGRNARVTDGVERALGRPPRSFADYAASVPASTWAATPAAGLAS